MGLAFREQHIVGKSEKLEEAKRNNHYFSTVAFFKNETRASNLSQQDSPDLLPTFGVSLLTW